MRKRGAPGVSIICTRNVKQETVGELNFGRKQLTRARPCSNVCTFRSESIRDPAARLHACVQEGPDQICAYLELDKNSLRLYFGETKRLIIPI